MGILTKVLLFPFSRSKSSSSIITTSAGTDGQTTRRRNNSNSSSESSSSNDGLRKKASRTQTVTRSQAKRKSMSSLKMLSKRLSISPASTMTRSNSSPNFSNTIIPDNSSNNYTHVSNKHGLNTTYESCHEDEINHYIPNQFAGHDGTIDISLRLTNTNTTQILSDEARLKSVRFN